MWYDEMEEEQYCLKFPRNRSHCLELTREGGLRQVERFFLTHNLILMEKMAWRRGGMGLLSSPAADRMKFFE
jgi:hypothetical protein